MKLSLIYRLKRRRLVTLLVLVFGLLVFAAIWVPAWKTAGPVRAERVGDAMALVLREPPAEFGSEEEDSFKISWRDGKGEWSESGPFTGTVTASMGGDRLVVFHGRSYSTYRAGKPGEGPENERWDAWPHLWSVSAAAREGDQAWAFGTLDDRTIVAARLDGAVWKQLPELHRPEAVTDLTAAVSPAAGAETTQAQGAFLWWREGDKVWSSRVTPEGWASPTAMDVPAGARLEAATVGGAARLFVISDLRKSKLAISTVGADQNSWSVEKSLPWFTAAESISVAGGDTPSVAVATWLSVGWTTLREGNPELEQLDHTFLRYRPGAQQWFLSMMFASLGIIGIGVTLLFERRRVPQEMLLAQARMLSTVAPLSLRAFAASIDTLPFLIVFGWVAEQGIVSPLVATILAVAGCSAYCAAFEIWRGQTPGKMIVGLRVESTGGNPAGFARILLRNFVRCLELLVMLLPAVIMISTKRTQRLGDLLSGTMVVRAPQPAKAGEGEAR